MSDVCAITEPCGILVVDKPAGMTSHDVVGKIRRLFNTKRVGHTGTLDPMATGVLIILIGRAAKAEEYLAVHTKRYTAGMRLGLCTDTQDVGGTVLTVSDAVPDENAVRAAAAAFLGDSMQMPPMYSAIKVNGQKLVDLARRGIEVERQARPIHVSVLDVTPTQTPNEYCLDVACSGGTYIRTLCHDIGQKLGCGGAMSSLRRTVVGELTLDDAVTLETLESETPAERCAHLLPTETVFTDFPAVRTEPFFAGLLRDGCAVEQKKLKTDLPVGTLCTLWRHRASGDGDEFFAVGKAVVNEDGALCIKCDKIMII